VPWPTPQEYNEAVQTPKLSFRDPELAAGTPDVTALGLPRPVTGNFASVYRLRCGRRDWAVRCFWREYADMRLRYAAISDHLGAVQLPYTVGFDYLDDGVRLGSRWYPVLKMEWVEGELLNSYVERNLCNPRAIADLAERWLVMVSRLERAGSAHGDLQHGNVMVVSGELKLVDYDAMFVPALAGRGSHEIGHQNYQHPRRSGDDYGAWIDRFSAWVIYVSLVAVAADPGLWSRLSAGDEALLFKKKDFCRPAGSTALQVLRQHDDDRVRRLASDFSDLLGSEPSRIPPLQAPGDASRLRSTGRGAFPTGVRLAWRSLVPSAQPAVGAAGLTTAPASALPVWLQDHVPAGLPSCADFDGSTLAPRIVLAAPLAVLGLAAALLGIQGIASVELIPGAVPVVVIADLSALIFFFRREPAVRDMRRLIRKESKSLHSLRRLELSSDRLDRARAESARHVAARRQRAVDDRAALEDRERRERDEASRIRDAAIAAIDLRLREVGEQQVTSLARALERTRAEHVRARLKERAIGSAEIPGLTAPSRLRLWAAGARTAADLTAERIRAVQWLDPKTLLALATWRVAGEREARRTAPKRLTAEERERVSAPYTRRRERLQAERAHANQAAAGVDHAITRHFARRYQPIDADLSKIDQQRVDADAKIAEQLHELMTAQAAELRRLAAIRLDLEPYREITFRRYATRVLRRRRGTHPVRTAENRL
jgi:hypothetical protein